MRCCLVLLLLVVTAPPAFAGTATSHHSLLQVEAAFYRAYLPFQTEWTRTPANHYLVPEPNPVAALPTRFRLHAVGWAGGANSSTFKTWSVYVFDRDSYAESLSRSWCRKSGCRGVIVAIAGNVMYFGSPLAAAARAMKWLRAH